MEKFGYVRHGCMGMVRVTSRVRVGVIVMVTAGECKDECMGNVYVGECEVGVGVRARR